MELVRPAPKPTKAPTREATKERIFAQHCSGVSAGETVPTKVTQVSTEDASGTRAINAQSGVGRVTIRWSSLQPWCWLYCFCCSSLLWCV